MAAMAAVEAWVTTQAAARAVVTEAVTAMAAEAMPMDGRERGAEEAIGCWAAAARSGGDWSNERRCGGGKGGGGGGDGGAGQGDRGDGGDCGDGGDGKRHGSGRLPSGQAKQKYQRACQKRDGRTERTRGRGCERYLSQDELD